MEIHVVQAGETLYSIAGRYGIGIPLLEELNGVSGDGALAVGQTLVIRRPATFHIVQPGQTLTGIAGQYGVTLRQLYRRNFGLSAVARLRATFGPVHTSVYRIFIGNIKIKRRNLYELHKKLPPAPVGRE